MKTAAQNGKHGTSTTLYIHTWYGSAQKCQRSHSHWEKPQAKGSETGDISSRGQNEAPACQVLKRGVADNVVGVGEAELGEGGVVHQVEQGVGGDVGGGHIEDHQLLQLLHPLQAGDLIAYRLQSSTVALEQVTKRHSGIGTSYKAETVVVEQVTKQHSGIGTGYKAAQWHWNKLQSRNSGGGTGYKTAQWQWNRLQSSTVALEQVTKQKQWWWNRLQNSTVAMEQVTKQQRWHWNRLQNSTVAMEQVTKQHSGIGTHYKTA